MASKRRMVFRDGNDVAENEAVGLATASPGGGEEVTEQHHKDDTDINVLVARFARGLPVPPPLDRSFYRDIVEAPDLRTVLDQVKAAEDRFLEWDPAIRKKFDNDFAQAWEWLNNSDNHDEAVRLGLLKREEAPKEPEPLRVRVVDPTAS